MPGSIAVFFISLGIGQIFSSLLHLQGASLAGENRWPGVLLGGGLLLTGGWILPHSWLVLLWVPLMMPLALLALLGGGSFIKPMSPPVTLFTANHPAHGGCRRVDIAAGNDSIPGLLLLPPARVQNKGAAVCIIPGAGDTKTFFKWRLVRSLLAGGFTVLTIDPPGHGEYRHCPLVYPDCLSSISVALRYLRVQAGVGRVGVVGISLGGALAINALTEFGDNLVDALVVVATPVRLNYSPSLFYRELWNTCYRSPVLLLMREITIKQVWDTWRQGGYTSKHSTGQLFELLNPVGRIERLKNLPALLVYSRRDLVAPPEHATAMQIAAPHANFVESKKAGHVMLTLIPAVNQQIVNWLDEKLA